MTTERLEVQRTIAADPAAIFRVLCDPQGHVAIDSSGMLMSATGDPVTAVGDSFVVHMDREALNDYPLGLYDVTVTIRTFVPDREIAWTVVGVVRPPIGHVYGYTLEPTDDGTLVTSYYDWSTIDPTWKEREIFPIISEGALRATLGILARTVAHGGRSDWRVVADCPGQAQSTQTPSGPNCSMCLIIPHPGHSRSRMTGGGLGLAAVLARRVPARSLGSDATPRRRGTADLAGADPIGELLEAGDRRADQRGALPVELVGAGRQVGERHPTEPLDGPPVAVTLGRQIGVELVRPGDGADDQVASWRVGHQDDVADRDLLHELDEHRRLPIECVARRFGDEQPPDRAVREVTCRREP